MIERIAVGRANMVLCLVAMVLSQRGFDHEHFRFKTRA